MPQSAALAVAASMCASGSLKAAVRILLAVECYLRSGELVSLKREFVAFPEDGMIRLGRRAMYSMETVIRLRVTRTGREQSVSVRDPEVLKLLRVIVRETEAGCLLFPYRPAPTPTVVQVCVRGHAAWQQWIRVALTATRRSHPGLCHQTPKLEDIMLRGRWESNKTAWRYIQRGLALVLANKIPDKVCRIADDLTRPSLARNMVEFRCD
jgi:hypothetical protein